MVQQKTPKALRLRGFWCLMVLDEAGYWGEVRGLNP